jgi:hypothetical protein
MIRCDYGRQAKIHWSVGPITSTIGGKRSVRAPGGGGGYWGAQLTETILLPPVAAQIENPRPDLAAVHFASEQGRLYCQPHKVALHTLQQTEH